MIKKIAYLALTIAGILFIAYHFQPARTGKKLAASSKYQYAGSWLTLPTDLYLGNPTALDIDTNGNLVVFHRAGREWPLFGLMPDEPIENNTVLIIGKDSGNLVNSWGGNMFVMPHGLTVDKDNNTWLTDVGLNQVFKFNSDGKLLLKIGEATIGGDDSIHFDKPTDVAIAQDGSFYVSDGYGNSRIIKFSPQGKYLFEWGRKGDKQGEFNIPHGIDLDSAGNVYVADRENQRIQVFDPNGRFIDQYADETFGAICSVAFDKTRTKLFAADDFTFMKLKHRGSDVFVFDTSGRIQERFGRSGLYTGKTAWYHDLAIDKDGNIYVGDILGNTIQKFTKTGK